MKTYNYAEAQQNLSLVLNMAVSEDVIIKRQDGIGFKLVYLNENTNNRRSLFDVEGINTNVTTQELVNIVREQRELHPK
jgi:hypothetical protein